MHVPVTIRGELEVRVEDLPPSALELIQSALSFHNEDKEIQAREQVAGWWDLPDTINLWRVEVRRQTGSVLVMPRGFRTSLEMGLGALGSGIEWIDERVSCPAAPGYFRPFLMRDYQLWAAGDMLKNEQGFYESPTGGGKTVTVLGTAAHAQQRTLVIVDQADLMAQWCEEAFRFLKLGYKITDEEAEDWESEELEELQALYESGRRVGRIGQNEWDEQDLTIALRQSLWSRIHELDATNWWAQCGMTVIDEGHQMPGETMSEIVRRASSKFLFAVSATPARSQVQGQVVEALVGPIIHKTPRSILRERGVLATMKVKQVPTKFTSDFWPTHNAEQDNESGKWVCKTPGCKKKGRHSHRNNWSSFQKKLVEDPDRNALIADEIVSDRGHIHLVPSRQKKHLDLLKKAIVAAGWDGPIFFLRGEENAKKESRKIVRQIKASQEAVILSTVAGKGLNIPPIDRIHIVFPLRQPAATVQLIGRGERAFEGKDHCLIKDYIDDAPVIHGQAYEREKVYREIGLEVDTIAFPKDDPILFDRGPFSSFWHLWPIEIEHPFREGEMVLLKTREHGFQAIKATTEEDYDFVIAADTAMEAKQRGRQIKLRPDWEKIKYREMSDLIRCQVNAYRDLAAMLESTEDREIIEHRPDPEWGDNLDGVGKNLLGKAWMEIRAERRS